VKRCKQFPALHLSIYFSFVAPRGESGNASHGLVSPSTVCKIVGEREVLLLRVRRSSSVEAKTWRTSFRL
jgi:hypothetical protein